jgi:hypothetical protein
MKRHLAARWLTRVFRPFRRLEFASMSDQSEKRAAREAAHEAAEKVAASLVEDPSVIRSLVSGPTNAIPLETGDPVPGGIRPGPETGHKPSEPDALAEPAGSQPKSE